MHFTDVCFITSDVLRLRTFYEAVFGAKAEGDEVHSFIAVGGLTIVFDHDKELQGTNAFGYVKNQSGNNTVIGFNVDDVDIQYARLKEMGVDTLNSPTTHPWGARSFQFKDPDGNILNFRTIVRQP